MLHHILLIIAGIFAYIFIAIIHYQFLVRKLKWGKDSDGVMLGSMVWPVFTTFWFVIGFFYCPVAGVLWLFKKGGRLLGRKVVVEEVK